MASIMRKLRRRSDRDGANKRKNRRSKSRSLFCLSSPETDETDGLKRPIEQESKKHNKKKMGMAESKALKGSKSELVEFGKEPTEAENGEKETKTSESGSSGTDKKGGNEHANGADERDITVEVHDKENAAKDRLPSTNSDGKHSEPNKVTNGKAEPDSDSESSTYSSCDEHASKSSRKVKDSKTYREDKEKADENIDQLGGEFNGKDDDGETKNKSSDSSSSSDNSDEEIPDKAELETNTDNPEKKKNKDENEHKSDSLKKKKHPLGRMKSKLLDVISYKNFDSYTPEVCIDFLQSPNLHFLTALNKKLKQNIKEWNSEFLELNGSEALLDLIDTLGIKRVTQLADALLILECVQCVKTIMNSKMGLAYLVEHGDYLKRLVNGKLYYFFISVLSKPSLF